MQSLHRFLLLAVVLFIGIGSAFAQAPNTFSYQGKLTNADGTAPTDGVYNLTFRLYDQATEGTTLWEEAHTVEVVSGLFNTALGATTPLDLPFDAPYWLGITLGTGDEMTPRLALSGSPYSILAQTVADSSVSLSKIDPSGASDGQVLAVEGGNAIWKTVEAENGTGVPTNSLSAADGDPETAVFVDNEGNVGIGRTNPIRALSVNGSLTFSNVTDPDEAEEKPLAFIFESGTANPLRGLFAHSPGFPDWGIFYEDAPDEIHFLGDGNEALTVQLSQRRVGISNNDPTERLSVGGRIESTEGGFKFPDGTVQTTAAFDPDSIETGIPGVNSVPRNDDFVVLVNRENRVGAEWFGVRAPVAAENQYGGMYIETNGEDIDNSKPFYGYAHNGQATGWHEIDGLSNEWRLILNNAVRFKVDGDDGNVFADGTFNPGGADLAEAFAVEGATSAYEPGDVLVISTSTDRTVALSAEPYSTLVAGVYAMKPGVLLSEHGLSGTTEDEVPMGVVGVVPTKVTLEGGAIKRGDLLVTSSTPGRAMKADPDRLGFGMVIGKALQDFDGSGTARINVLVNVK